MWCDARLIHDWKCSFGKHCSALDRHSIFVSVVSLSFGAEVWTLIPTSAEVTLQVYFNPATSPYFTAVMSAFFHIKVISCLHSKVVSPHIFGSDLRLESYAIGTNYTSACNLLKIVNHSYHPSKQSPRHEFLRYFQWHVYCQSLPWPRTSQHLTASGLW